MSRRSSHVDDSSRGHAVDARRCRASLSRRSSKSTRKVFNSYSLSLWGRVLRDPQEKKGIHKGYEGGCRPSAFAGEGPTYHEWMTKIMVHVGECEKSSGLVVGTGPIPRTKIDVGEYPIEVAFRDEADEVTLCCMYLSSGTHKEPGRTPFQVVASVKDGIDSRGRGKSRTVSNRAQLTRNGRPQEHVDLPARKEDECVGGHLHEV